VIFACSLSRTVHLELLRNLETSTFIVPWNDLSLVAVHTNNGGAFVKAIKWLEQLRKDDSLRGFAEEYDFKWKFNLKSGTLVGRPIRAPRRGSQVSHVQYKVIGGGHLTWDEINEVLLDVIIEINRRPLW
jgi:hypothetical protein